ncbi:MAG: hypothetical protein H6R07_1053 [Proteobacteria bacterium]|nr:hypothetical protein [Pseudomonadota bacterium]
MKIIAVISFLAISFLSGCAGTNFVRTSDDQLIIGKTTEAELKAKLGAPYREGTVTKNDQQIKTMSYAYASTSGEAAAPGVTAARSQGYYIFKDVLAGHEFTSSWKQDSTDFDESKISQIVKGKSTRKDVTALYGLPNGKYAYPVIPAQGDEAYVYLYSQTSGSAFSLKFFNKLLVITFGADGIAKNVEFSSSGQK